MGRNGFFKVDLVLHRYKIVFLSGIKIVRNFACFHGEG